MDPLLMRFIERLVAVLIGGLCIWLGYRLFQSLPEQRDSSGKIELPKVSIILSHVGPGVFFALFGTIAVGLSLLQPLEFNDREGASSFSYAGASIGKGGYRDDEALSDARALLRSDFASLNSVPNQLPVDARDQVERSIVRVKLALLQPLWGTPEDGYGDINRFAEWVRSGAVDAPPEDSPGALELWRYGQPMP